MKYAVVYEQTPRNWAAYVPDLPGCVATGATRDQVEGLIREGIRLHLELCGSGIRLMVWSCPGAELTARKRMPMAPTWPKIAAGRNGRACRTRKSAEVGR